MLQKKPTEEDGVYEGDIIDGLANGKGKITYQDGKVEEAQWEDGELI